MPLLLLKAKVRGDDKTGDLFARPVQVEGHLRGGTYVAPYTAIRERKADPPPAAPAALAPRATYPDGRLVPLDGEKVFQAVAGMFGLPATIHGVVKGKRVQTTGVTSALGGSTGKVYPLTEHWTVVGDPELARRREAREAAEREKKAAREAELQAEQDRLDALARERGTISPDDVQPGDIIEDPEGVPWLVEGKGPEGAGIYGYPVGDDDRHAGGISDYRGWRKRPDLTAPEGTVITRYMPGDTWRGTHFVKVEGEWRQAAWNEEAEAYLPSPDAEEPTPAPEPPAPPPPPPPPPAPKLVVLARPQRTNPLDEQRATIARLESSRFISASSERALELARARVAADPKKWKPGMGARYAVYSGGRAEQWNRGFRVVEVDADAKMALLRQVADTGLTETGGNHDRIGDEWHFMGDMRRDTAHDAPDLAGGRPTTDLSAMPKGKLAEAYERASEADRRITRALVAAGYGDLKPAGVEELAAKGDKLAKLAVRSRAWFNAVVSERDARRHWSGTDNPLPAEHRTRPPEGVAPVPEKELPPTEGPGGVPVGIIHRTFTGDHTSEIHYATDAKGGVWKRHQFRDPRFGWKWGPWKFHAGPMPRDAFNIGQKARLPG